MVSPCMFAQVFFSCMAAVTSKGSPRKALLEEAMKRLCATSRHRYTSGNASYRLRFTIRLMITAAPINRATTARRRNPIQLAAWVAAAIPTNPNVNTRSRTSEASAKATRCPVVNEEAEAGAKRVSSVPGLFITSGYGLPELLYRLRCFFTRLMSVR